MAHHEDLDCSPTTPPEGHGVATEILLEHHWIWGGALPRNGAGITFKFQIQVSKDIEIWQVPHQPASFLQEFSSRRGDVSSKLNMESMDETALVSPGLPGTEEKQLGLCVFFPNLEASTTKHRCRA